MPDPESTADGEAPPQEAAADAAPGLVAAPRDFD
jgi:hypothetical protein